MTVASTEHDSAELFRTSEYCSICLDGVIDSGKRSIAKLKCGHHFHMDCIGFAFNIKGAMQCPNCRHTENGQWLYPNGSGLIDYTSIEVTDLTNYLAHLSEEFQTTPMQEGISHQDDNFGNLLAHHLAQLSEEFQRTPTPMQEELLHQEADLENHIADLSEQVQRTPMEEAILYYYNDLERRLAYLSEGFQEGIGRNELPAMARIE